MFKKTLIAAAVAAGITLTAAPAVPAATDGPSLACATAEDCQVVIDQLYPQLVDLGAEVNDLREIRTRSERKIARKDARILLLQEKLATARANR